MLTETTVNKLHEMKLSVMAKAFRAQLTDPNMQGLSFEDRFGLIVDQEWTTRKNNHLKKLIKQARFSEPGACIEDIEYHTDRNLDQAQIARLSGCDYITEKHWALPGAVKPISHAHLECLLSGISLQSDMSGFPTCLPSLPLREETGRSGKQSNSTRNRHC